MDMQANHDFRGDSTNDAVDLAAHDADRRQYARNIRVMRVARLTDVQLHAEGLGMVRDVSPGGMMIDAHFALEIGQVVSIALMDDQELTGEVVWKDGQTVGVHFDSEIAVEHILAKPAYTSDGSRARLPRFAICKDVRLSVDTQQITAELNDLSQRGAKLRCQTKFRMHGNVLIKLADHRPVRATVKWRGGDFTGVEFHRLLSVDELAQWLGPDS
jgi:hypothetical protein